METHIHFDANSNETLMRRVSIPEMFLLAKSPDPEDRLLLNEELSQAKPNEDVIEALLKYYPDRIKMLNSSKELPLHVACNNINTIDSGILLLILESYPAAISVANKFGLLPLHKAVRAPLPKLPVFDNISMIIEAYPKGLEARNIDGQLPLHIACTAPLSSVLVEQLAEGYKAGLLISDLYGQNPLHKAVCYTGTEAATIVTYLIESQPKAAGRTDKDGKLPLHWAVSRDKPVLDIVIDLIDAHEEGVMQCDHSGLLPVDVLLRRGNNRCGATMSLLLATFNKLREMGHQVKRIKKVIKKGAGDGKKKKK